jgi:hypothetical protein
MRRIERGVRTGAFGWIPNPWQAFGSDCHAMVRSTIQRFGKTTNPLT